MIPLFVDDEGRGIRIPLAFPPPVAYLGAKHRMYSQAMDWMRPELRECRVWCEPFAGGAGALWWALGAGLRPKLIVLGEANAGMRGFWRKMASGRLWSSVERADAMLKEALTMTRAHDIDSAAAMYARVRRRYNRRHKTSDFLFLVRTSFNNLVRFNSRGEFNAPHGFSDKYQVKQLETRGIESLLELVRTGTRIEVFDDWRKAAGRLEGERPQEVIASIDPPYIDPKGFADYAGNGFGPRDHKRLAKAIEGLETRGVRWLLHGNANPESLRLYDHERRGWGLWRVGVVRTMSSDADTRGAVQEWIWASQNWKGLGHDH